MINEKIVMEFNEVSTTDYIDVSYLTCDNKEKSEVLKHQYYYLLPLVERLCRDILHRQDFNVVDIETNNSQYRTFYSIIYNNKKILTKLIGEDAVICISDVFSNDGIRNRVLHNKPINSSGIFEYELISTYKWLLEALESILKCYLDIR